jgi:TrmH family RNA methyltransferase
LYLIEGEKLLQEAISNKAPIVEVYGTEKHSIIDNIVEISEHELKQISSLKSPNKFVATVKINDDHELKSEGWTIVLEDINDPGNLGTIIRLAVWFGFDNVICSQNSCDPYQSKVVQSTMGGIFKIPVVKMNLDDFFDNETRRVYTAEMSGENSKEVDFPAKGVLLMGSESHGVSSHYSERFSKQITIENYGDMESLNVATAAAILMSQIRA